MSAHNAQKNEFSIGYFPMRKTKNAPSCEIFSLSAESPRWTITKTTKCTNNNQVKIGKSSGYAICCWVGFVFLCLSLSLKWVLKYFIYLVFSYASLNHVFFVVRLPLIEMKNCSRVGKLFKAGNGQAAKRPKGISIANWISVGKSSDDGGVAHIHNCNLCATV